MSGQTSTHYTSSPIIGQSVLYVFKAAGSLHFLKVCLPGLLHGVAGQEFRYRT